MLFGDGYADTGMNLTSSNMFSYCVNNPANYSDPSGSCPYNGTAADFHRLEQGLPSIDCTCVGRNVASALLKSAEYACVGSKIGVELGKHVYTTAPRPNNIGPGTYKKYTATKIIELNRVSSVIDSISTYTGVLGIAVDVGNGIDTNLKNGESVGKIMWDAKIDVTFSATNFWISSAVGASIGSAICPGVGTIAGTVLGSFFGFVLDLASQEPRRQVKSLY